MKTYIHYQTYLMRKSWVENKDVVNCAPDPLLFVFQFLLDRAYLREEIRNFIYGYRRWLNALNDTERTKIIKVNLV